jgi:hypothetical protein
VHCWWAPAAGANNLKADAAAANNETLLQMQLVIIIPGEYIANSPIIVTRVIALGANSANAHRRRLRNARLQVSAHSLHNYHVAREVCVCNWPAVPAPRAVITPEVTLASNSIN